MHILHKILFLTLMISMTSSHGLDSDADQPATLEADEFEMFLNSGIRVYRGDAIFNQGSIHLRCDELTTFHNDDELDRAECVGKPGEFKQRPEGAEHDMLGFALTITMDEMNRLVTFESQAKVVQDNHIMTGSVITYDMDTKQIKAWGKTTQTDDATEVSESNQQTDSPNGSLRTVLVIQPKKKKHD